MTFWWYKLLHKKITMIGGILLTIGIIIMILSFVLICLCVGGALGVFKIVAPMFSRLLASSYDRRYESDGNPLNDQCFICLEPVTNEVVATCNHGFCGMFILIQGKCIVDYIRSRQNEQIKCPACREDVIVLLRRFQVRNTEQNNLKQAVCQYNAQFDSQPGVQLLLLQFFRSIREFKNMIGNIPLLFGYRGISYLLGDSRLRGLILMLIYTLSPVDFLPEMALGPLGLLDDGLILAGIARQMSAILYGFVRDQARRGE